MNTVSLAGLLIASTVGAVAAADGRRPGTGFFVSGSEPVDLGEDFTQIQVLSSLPRGSYVANAIAVLAASGQLFRSVDCRFTLDGSFQGDLARGTLGGDFNNFLTLPLTIGFTIDMTQDLGVECRGAPGVVSQPSSLTAIRVNRLTVQ